MLKSKTRSLAKPCVCARLGCWETISLQEGAPHFAHPTTPGTERHCPGKGKVLEQCYCPGTADTNSQTMCKRQRGVWVGGLSWSEGQ